MFTTRCERRTKKNISYALPIVFLAGIQNFQLNVSLFFPEFLKYILITDFKAFAFFVFDTNRFVLLINFAVDLSVTFFSVQYVL